MKKIFLLIFLFLYISVCLVIFSLGQKEVKSAHYAGPLAGYILLQVEAKGEAYYIYPKDGKRYYLGRPADAFSVMKKLSLGAKHDFIKNTSIFPERLAGFILLDAEANGEAYYIYPKNRKKYYLGRPADAFLVMRELGLGVKNDILINIPEAEINEPEEKITINKLFVISHVPFTAQAPFGDWSDQRFQDGCEEASALMAIKWARNEKITNDEASSEILKISDYLNEKYGEYRDISSSDTIAWIFNDYFNYRRVDLIRDITPDDIVDQLSKGNLVITPMNGQIMHNPYYRSPGPPRHMIVIRGWDPTSSEFITNDPGTRRGELYRYDAKILYEAIRDYPTGYHEFIPEIKKNMIVVRK